MQKSSVFSIYSCRRVDGAALCGSDCDDLTFRILLQGKVTVSARAVPLGDVVDVVAALGAVHHGPGCEVIDLLRADACVFIRVPVLTFRVLQHPRACVVPRCALRHCGDCTGSPEKVLLG